MGLAPRWRKVVRDLTGHRLKTALVVISIAVGIFSVGVVMGGRGVLTREFDTDYLSSRAPSAEFITSDFDESLLRAVARRSDVLGADARRQFAVRYSDAAQPASSSAGWPTMQVWGLPDFEDISVQKLTREQSTSWPPGPGEIVLEKSVLLVKKLEIGQTIVVETDDGTRVPLRIVGYAHDINAVPTKFSDVAVGYTSMPALTDLKEPEKFNYLGISLDPSLSQAAGSRIAVDIRDRVLAPAGVQAYRTTVPKPGSHFLGDIFKALSLLLLALGVMALALSGFLVVTTISALMAQQIKQVGVMKAVGGRASQVMGMYLTLVGIYGVLAVAVGMPLTLWGGKWFTEYAAGLLNFRLTSVTPPAYVIAIEIAVGLLVPLLAAVVPVRAGSRTSVVTALSATGVSADFGNGLVDRALGLIRGLPRPVALSLRNTFLRKGRLAMTLLTLTLASAVVMAVLTVRTSTLQTVDDIAAFWVYDALAYFSDPEPGVDVEREAAKVPGVTAVEIRRNSSASLKRPDGSENQGIDVIGLPWDSTFINPTLADGRWLESGDDHGIVINTDVVKDQPNLDVGDTVRLTIRGADTDWKIVGIASGQMRGPMIFVDRSALDAAIDGGGGVTRVLVKTDIHTSAEQQKVASDLEDRLSDAGFSVSGSETQIAWKDAIASQLGILVTFLVIMAALLSIVGVIGLTGTMTINVLESTREIGVMRSIGASHGSIFNIFITEGVVVALMAWGMGAVLSWPLSMWLVSALGGAMSLPLAYKFSWGGVGLWLVSVLVIAVVASLVPAWNASRVSVRDAIAYE
ncbi:MAG: ABC transporter permease [Coriobacteriia bacterium]|nr:ABC transporter permease [Coriobacteriia bacterium]